MSKFDHMELHTTDTAGAKKFYGKLFGWKFNDVPMPHGIYTLIDDFGGMVEGQPGVPPNWLGYVTVKSVKRTIPKIEKLGGKILMGLTHAGDHGVFAVATDPQGAPFAIWESKAKHDDKAKKKATKKKAAKKATKKKAAKKAAKKATKKKAAKKATKKKAAKKKPAKKKPAKKKATKKKK